MVSRLFPFWWLVAPTQLLTNRSFEQGSGAYDITDWTLGAYCEVLDYCKRIELANAFDGDWVFWILHALTPATCFIEQTVSEQPKCSDLTEFSVYYAENLISSYIYLQIFYVEGGSQLEQITGESQNWMWKKFSFDLSLLDGDKHVDKVRISTSGAIRLVYFDLASLLAKV